MGLRQGDPLSRYLFVFCMKRLSFLINRKVVEANWKGIKVSRNSPPLTHLFFADDLILFGVDNFSNCHAMLNVLTCFCEMSGQSINFNKSKMYISPNVQRRRANRLCNVVGIQHTIDLGKYLGIPLLHSRASKVHFNDLVDKVQSRLDGWINNTLNFAGRATMVQSVSSTIPSYMMQTMELPMGVCDKLDRILTVIFSEKLSIMNINSGFLFLEVSISKTTLFPIGLIKKPTSFV